MFSSVPFVKAHMSFIEAFIGMKQHELFGSVNYASESPDLLDVAKKIREAYRNFYQKNPVVD